MIVKEKGDGHCLTSIRKRPWCIDPIRESEERGRE